KVLHPLHSAGADVDPRGALGAELRGLEGAALEVARIDGPGLAPEEDLPGVDVAERPVVEAGPPEVLQGAGGVVVVARLAAHVRVEESHVQPRLPGAREGARQVGPLRPPAEA